MIHKIYKMFHKMIKIHKKTKIPISNRMVNKSIKTKIKINLVSNKTY
jgi:hypothetical protein